MPEALAHATPTQARRVRAYYIAGINANGDTVFENAVSPFAFLLLQANGGCGQHDLILYGDHADTELLQTLHIHIGVQAVAA